MMIILIRYEFQIINKIKYLSLGKNKRKLKLFKKTTLLCSEINYG